MPRGSKPIDLSGQKFGLLSAIEVSGKDKHGNVMWRCSCECNSIITVTSRDLRTGHTKSCGCLKIAMLKSRVTKHGRSGTRLYMVWQEMVARCHRPSHKNFPFYGGRGIAVCDEWQSSFEKFAEDMGHPPSGHSLERVDNDGNYSKSNCRWANKEDQMNNRRNNVIISFDGREMTMAQFAKMLGFAYGKVRSAVNRGVCNIGGYEVRVIRQSKVSPNNN